MRWKRVWYKEGKWTAKAGVLKQIRAAQSPGKGKEERVRLSKEMHAFSVRKTQHGQGRERALQGVSNLEKMAWQTTTGL